MSTATALKHSTKAPVCPSDSLSSLSLFAVRFFSYCFFYFYAYYFFAGKHSPKRIR